MQPPGVHSKILRNLTSFHSIPIPALVSLHSLHSLDAHNSRHTLDSRHVSRSSARIKEKEHAKEKRAEERAAAAESKVKAREEAAKSKEEVSNSTTNST